MEIFIRILDVLAWPSTVLTLAILFRKAIISLFDRASKFTVHIAGQKLSLEERERQIEKKETIEKIENLIEPTVRDRIIKELGKIARSEKFDEQDLTTLLLIKDAKKISKPALESEMQKMNMRAGLGGALTGLQHDELIVGHFEDSDIQLTEKGIELLKTLK